MENDLINKLTMRTGDPFADTGAWVIEILNKQYPEKNILELIEDVAKVYALDWDGKINAFFLNSTITHHARKGIEKVRATTEYYKSLLDESAPYIEGRCRLLGIKSKLFASGRENNILCGSGTFINFHHAFQPGVMLSKEALIRIFFIPLGALSVGNLVAVINSNQPKIEKWFVQENFDENIKRLANKTSGGILSSQFKNPANALFGFAKSCITRYAGQFSEDEPVEMNLYHFSNFGAEPKISLYCFSAPLFKFYQKILHSRFLRDWEKFINYHYRNNASTFHEGDEQDYFLVTEKKETTKIEQDSFSTWYNPIYDRLLKDENILKDFRNWAKKQYHDRKQFKITHIVHLYQNFLNGMRKETLSKIESIATFIVEDAAKRKSRLTKLRKTKPGADFRGFLLTLIRDNVENKSTVPLITLRDYVEYLFPDGQYGAEIRDLLLISVYEKLCDLQAFDDVEAFEDDTETETEFSSTQN